MAGVKKDELRRVLGQVVSYDGGNKVGTISSVIGDGILSLERKLTSFHIY